MEPLVIPSSPNWFLSDVMACAPDNTLIYGSRQDIVVIKPITATIDDVLTISRAHSTKVISVNINKNWGEPNKYAVTLSEDSIVKLWNIENLEKKMSHRSQPTAEDSSMTIGAAFAGNERVVTVSEKGTIFIWNVINGEGITLPSLLGKSKVSVTCLSICPHASWLAAFGMKSGLVVVVDLRRKGRVLYNLRGHSSEVVSLSWCPAPVNVFPSRPQNRLIEKKRTIVAIGNDARRKQKYPQKLSFPWTERVVLGSEPSSERQRFMFTSKAFRKRTHSGANARSRRQKFDVARLFRILTGSDQGSDVVTDRGPTFFDPFENTQIDRGKSVHSNTRQECDTSTNMKIVPMDISNSSERFEAKILIAPYPTPPTNDSPASLTDRRILPMDVCSTPEIHDQILERPHENVLDVNTGADNGTTISSTNLGATTDEKCASEDFRTTSKPGTTIKMPSVEISVSSEDSNLFGSVSSEEKEPKTDRKSPNLDESMRSGVSDASEVFHDARNDSVVKGDDSEPENWRSEQPVAIEEEPRKEFLLATSAREPNIYIWRAGTDGRLQTFLTVPSLPRNLRKKAYPPKGRSWIVLCWVAPTVLLSSSRTAELLQWTLPKPLDQVKYPLVVHRQHWSALFCVKAPIEYSDEYDFMHKRATNAWTTGKDRWITDVNYVNKKIQANYMALGGSCNCIAGSPLDPSRLTFGLGEGVISVWNVSQGISRVLPFHAYYQDILSAVTAVAWHPTIDNSLAWGTVGGRVGVLELSNKGGRKCKLMPHYFNSQIFKVEWGPRDPVDGTTKLFVVSEGQIVTFNPESADSKPQLLEVPEKDVSVYTIAWEPSHKVLLVSTKSGTLLSYSPELTSFFGSMYLNQKVQSILWHPNAALDHGNYSQTIASIVKNTKFCVFDLETTRENLEEAIVAEFENRNVKINDLAWCPFKVNILAFVDDEGVAQVYDIVSKTIISTFINPGLDPLLCVHWSPENADCVIVGATSHKIIVWRISQHLGLTDKAIITQRNELLKAQQKEVSDLVRPKETIEKIPVVDENTRTKSQKKSQILPLFYSIKDDTRAHDLRRLLRWKQGKEELEPRVLSEGNKFDVLEIFGNTGFMERIFEVNQENLNMQGTRHKACMLSLFQGNVATPMKLAIEQKRVTPWIISMSPMVSMDTYQKACKTYVEQLLEQPEADPLEIVTYMLANHKVMESIDLLCDRHLFREALALGRARFGPEGTVVTQILEKWGHHNKFQGNYELAACCYIALGEFEKAAKVLFRRPVAEVLEVCVELADACGKTDLRDATIGRINYLRGTKESEAHPVDVNPGQTVMTEESESPEENKLTKEMQVDATSVTSEVYEDASSDNKEVEDLETALHKSNLENATEDDCVTSMELIEQSKKLTVDTDLEQ